MGVLPLSGGEVAEADQMEVSADLERCDREIAAAYEALMRGPDEDLALIWWRDWVWEAALLSGRLAPQQSGIVEEDDLARGFVGAEHAALRVPVDGLEEAGHVFEER